MTWFLFGAFCGLIIGVLIDKDNIYNIKARKWGKGDQTIHDINIKSKEGIFKRLKKRKNEK